MHWVLYFGITMGSHQPSSKMGLQWDLIITMGLQWDLYFTSGSPYSVETLWTRFRDAAALRQLSARGLPAMTADPMMQLGPAGRKLPTFTDVVMSYTWGTQQHTDLVNFLWRCSPIFGIPIF